VKKMLTFESIDLFLPEECNIVLGQTHFIKSVEDIAEVTITAVPGIEYGLAFNEASGPCLIRTEGNNRELTDAAKLNAQNIAAGHIFVLLIRKAYPINLLNALKSTQEVCSIYAATANPLQVVVAQTEQGRGIMGVIDGSSPIGVEKAEDIAKRKSFLREIVGYKIGLTSNE
jgi:adenosine/AMP kinase